MEIIETDEVGRLTATYVVSQGKEKASCRVDVLPTTDSLPWAQRLLSVFLPLGYPHTVTSDYTPYQIYDSLQAFSSSIAGLLASRAVLQSIGVGDENASATAAMLLSVIQESVGRMATILFAHWGSRAIEAECKRYRLLADVLNDIAMILDCLNPAFPKPVRVPLFCAASAFRAMCGVAGGSSKAILSSHFAKADNIGELNAKDSSQETVISLLGMWVGGFVLSAVSSTFGTWTCLILLLSIHLSTNYAAVRSVALRTLNRQRANLAFSFFMEGQLLGPEQVSRQERVFEMDGVLRYQGGPVMGTCRIGCSIRDLLQCMNGVAAAKTGAFSGASTSLEVLLSVFAKEDYLLWFNPTERSSVIVLKDQANVRTQLKAWSHALIMTRFWQKVIETHDALNKHVTENLLRETLATHTEQFDNQLAQLEKAGWNLYIAVLETRPGQRIILSTQTLQHQSAD